MRHWSTEKPGRRVARLLSYKSRNKRCVPPVWDLRPQECPHRRDTDSARCEYSTAIPTVWIADKAGYVVLIAAERHLSVSSKYQSKCSRRLPPNRRAGSVTALATRTLGGKSNRQRYVEKFIYCPPLLDILPMSVIFSADHAICACHRGTPKLERHSARERVCLVACAVRPACVGSRCGRSRRYFAGSTAGHWLL